MVIGQVDFDSASANQGGDADAVTLNYPNGNPTLHDGVLYLPDTRNNRVLGFSNGIPTINNMYADFVLGQRSFQLTTLGTDADQFNYPQTVASHDDKLFLTDTNNHRVLVWNEAPTGDVGADVVIGQADMTSVDDNTCTQDRLWQAGSVFAVDGKLFVSDSNQNRVLIWNTIPTQNGQPADLVLGQADFESCGRNRAVDDSTGIPAADTLRWPNGIWSDGKRLVVSDAYNNRVLIWNSLPTQNGQPADLVLGQPDMNSDQEGTSRTQLHLPFALNSNGRQLFVADTWNNRVLIWDAIPSVNNAPADRVLGKADFTSLTALPGANSLSHPFGLLVFENKLLVADRTYNRYLVYEAP